MSTALASIALALTALVPAPAHAATAPAYAPHVTANTAATELSRGEYIEVPATVSDAMNARLAELGHDDTLEPVLRDVALLTCASDADCDLARTARGR